MAAYWSAMSLELGHRPKTSGMYRMPASCLALSAAGSARYASNWPTLIILPCGSPLHVQSESGLRVPDQPMGRKGRGHIALAPKRHRKAARQLVGVAPGSQADSGGRGTALTHGEHRRHSTCRGGWRPYRRELLVGDGGGSELGAASVACKLLKYLGRHLVM